MQQLNFSNNARSTLAIFCSLVVLFSNSGCKKKNNPIVATGLSIYQTKTATMVLNRTLQLTPTFTPENVFNKTLKYISSDSTIATVTDSGLITAIAVGSATITATTTDGSNKTDTVNITVVADADISIKNFTLNDGTRDYILTLSGDDFTYPNAPRSLSLPATTLTATFDLGSQHATISPDPRTAPLSYASKTQFTVTSGDGTRTHTYYVNVGADAYNATTNPYGIYTQDQLSDITNALTASYKLMNDIVLTGNWTPIAPAKTTDDSSHQYAGSFDGNGKVISNINPSATSDNYISLGLFGTIGTTGNVKNLGVKLANTGDVKSNILTGGLAGLNRGKISNCYVIGGGVKSDNNTGYIGGLVGNNVGGTISNCYVQINITGGASRIIGVLVGNNSNGGQINNCYTVGTATPNGAIYTGAIVGFSSSDPSLPTSVVSNCYWDSTTYNGTGIGNNASGSTATNVSGKSTTNMKMQATVDLLNGTPSSGAWKLNSGGYPKLSWEQ